MVQRIHIQSALECLQANNQAFTDIIISKYSLEMLHLNGELQDKGLARDQINPGEVEGQSNSSVLLPDQTLELRQEVENIVEDVMGEDHDNITINRRGTVTIPWPTHNNTPLSEFTTQYFFTMAFPALFPYGTADFHINHPRTCSSMCEWADHLLWFEDTRFANHPFFKFIVHNMIQRKVSNQNCILIVNQKIGEEHLTVSGLQDQLNSGDESATRKILYFSSCLHGTSQNWAQRGRELRALIQYQIHNDKGLPSFFASGSCAEYHFKPLRRLLQTYIQDYNNCTVLFDALEKNSHIVGKYVDLRTQSYFQDVMTPIFGVDTYWYRQ